MSARFDLPEQEKGADTVSALTRIAQALERLACTTADPAAALPDMTTSAAWIWVRDTETGPYGLRAVANINRVDLSHLQGIDAQKTILLENTRRFAHRRPANNALLWGARGMGKSSLVKAVHAAFEPDGLKIIEIERDDIASLPMLLRLLATQQTQRFILFCDDLSFDAGDTRYKALKAVLEGGIEGRPENVIFYATSNRRHIIAREAIENESDAALQTRDVVDDKVSLADRFGLWIGFHACSQDDYLAMVRNYARSYGIVMDDAQLCAQALEWQVTRGSRSGRVAFQFITDLLGRR
jgi:predicted AAA+ superfamily ATPase